MSWKLRATALTPSEKFKRVIDNRELFFPCQAFFFLGERFVQDHIPYISARNANQMMMMCSGKFVERRIIPKENLFHFPHLLQRLDFPIQRRLVVPFPVPNNPFDHVENRDRLRDFGQTLQYSLPRSGPATFFPRLNILFTIRILLHNSILMQLCCICQEGRNETENPPRKNRADQVKIINFPANQANIAGKHLFAFSSIARSASSKESSFTSAIFRTTSET